MDHKSIALFQAPERYFWTWADGGKVVEWNDLPSAFFREDLEKSEELYVLLDAKAQASYLDMTKGLQGKTICFRADLENLLEKLGKTGMPGVDTILLLMAACMDGWRHSDARMLFWHLTSFSVKVGDFPFDSEAIRLLASAMRLLDLVSELPAELKKGRARVLLFGELTAAMKYVIGPEKAKEAVLLLGTGLHDQQLLQPLPERAPGQILPALIDLTRAGRAFRSREDLELKLRTGLDALPPPIDLEIEELDLLTSLAQNEQTAGIARLTNRLLAAIHIPAQLVDASELPVGGVSDITNKGNFDRLLISELAHDDLTLMSRLINNEALFFRRESPPAPKTKERILLLDTTLRMWGMPRVFAIAAALACAQKDLQQMNTSAFAMGGEQFTEVDLKTKEGVVKALEQVDGAMSCVNGLLAFQAEIPPVPGQERIFITLEEQIGASLTGDLRKSLDFVIGLKRDGSLYFYRVLNGRLNLLNQAKFDLPSLLFKKDKSIPTPSGSSVLPKLVYEQVFPLNYPTFGYRPTGENCMGNYESGFLGVTPRQRVLFWSQRYKGARELLSFIEKGQYFFMPISSRVYGLFVNDPVLKVSKYYRFDLEQETVAEVELFEKLPIIRDIYHKGASWYVESNQVFEIDPDSARILEKLSEPGVKALKRNARDSQDYRSDIELEVKGIRKFIYNRYNVMRNVSKVAISEGRQLMLNHHPLLVKESQHLTWGDPSYPGKYEWTMAKPVEPMPLPTNAAIDFKRFVWEDGSEAWVDGRGMLYLRSSNPDLPEVSVVLVYNKSLAAWASDGYHAGFRYFIHVNNLSRYLPVRSFYKYYIVPFVDQILQQ